MNRMWILVFLFSLPALCEETGLTVPAGMESHVQFWVRVFTEFSVDQQILHDAEAPRRIYGVIDIQDLLPENHSPKEREAALDREKERISRALELLANPDSTAEKSLLKVFEGDTSDAVLLKASKNVRIQGGMREAFIEGLIRSGRYIDRMRRIFRAHSLPEELVYLPHVESSFHPSARSKSGAVGIWQFTRDGGRPYLTIGREVDERLDPFASTEAAARMLKRHYRVLEDWPLAVTAYCAGLARTQRAVEETGSTLLRDLITRYHSPSFGFASKNFYAEFIAAAQVAADYAEYFGPLELDPPVEFTEYRLQAAQDLGSIESLFAIGREELKALNPSLLAPIFRDGAEIPRGVVLRLPGTVEVAGLTDVSDSADAEPLFTVEELLDDTAAVAIPEQARLELRLEDKRLTVLPEETLGHYAEWLKMPTRHLRRLNGLGPDQAIHIGQEIRLSFNASTPEAFCQRREEYHRSIQRSFFSRYSIEGSREYTLRWGESLWSIARENNDVPLWLLLAWNRLEDPNRISTGQKITIPLVQRIRRP